MLISGKSFYAQIVGAPRQGKFHNGWSFELSVDEKTQDQLLKAGMRKSYLKNKGDERGTFLQFRRDAVRKNGEPGKSFEILTADGKAWPAGKLIGNGSTLNVVIALNERSYQGDKFLAPSAIKVQVWDYVPYEGKGNNFDELPVRENSGDEPVEELKSVAKISKKDW